MWVITITILHDAGVSNSQLLDQDIQEFEVMHPSRKVAKLITVLNERKAKRETQDRGGGR